MVSHFSEALANDGPADVKREHGWYGISNLRKLPSDGAKEHERIRECLQASTFPYGESSGNGRVQMGTASSVCASRDDRLRREGRVKSVNAAQVIALSIIENHVPGYGGGAMFTGDVIMDAAKRPGQGSRASDTTADWLREGKEIIASRPNDEKPLSSLRYAVISGVKHSRAMYCVSRRRHGMDRFL